MSPIINTKSRRTGARENTLVGNTKDFDIFQTRSRGSMESTRNYNEKMLHRYWHANNRVLSMQHFCVESAVIITFTKHNWIL